MSNFYAIHNFKNRKTLFEAILKLSYADLGVLALQNGFNIRSYSNTVLLAGDMVKYFWSQR